MKKNTKIVIGSLIAVAAIATGLFASNSSLFKGATIKKSSRQTINTQIYCGLTAVEAKMEQGVIQSGTTWTQIGKPVACLTKGKSYSLNAGFYIDKNPGTPIAAPSDIAVTWTSTDIKGLFYNASPEKDGEITPTDPSIMLITHLSTNYAGNGIGDITATLSGYKNTSGQYFIPSGAAKCIATIPQCK